MIAEKLPRRGNVTAAMIGQVAALRFEYDSRMRLETARWIDLPRRIDARGELTIVGHADIPFSIARMFYAHGVPPGGERGGHAHRVTEQFVIAIAGSFSLDLTDGRQTRSFRLETPHRGVYVPPMLWDRLHDFGRDAVCLVLASTQYAESDYVRNWNEFLRESATLET